VNLSAAAVSIRTVSGALRDAPAVDAGPHGGLRRPVALGDEALDLTRPLGMPGDREVTATLEEAQPAAGDQPGGLGEELRAVEAIRSARKEANLTLTPPCSREMQVLASSATTACGPASRRAAL